MESFSSSNSTSSVRNSSSSSNASDQTSASVILEQQRNVINEDGHQLVVAIVDASKEIALGALIWVLEKLQLGPGDKFIFLGVLQQISTPMGSKTRADPNSQTGYNMNVLIEEDRQRKKEEFDRNEELMKIQRQCEMKQVAETRFASHTIVMRRLLKVKDALSQMVIGHQWGVWKISNSERAQRIRDLILNESWWARVAYVLDFTEPIMTMLRFVDTDTPCLGDVYDGMDTMVEKVKHSIQAHESDPTQCEALCIQVQAIINHRWNKMTTPFHLLAYALSPRYYSEEIAGMSARVAPFADEQVAEGCHKALSRLFPLEEMHEKVREEFGLFASGLKHSPFALKDQNRMGAITWWYMYGQPFKHLQPLAIKVLSQIEFQVAVKAGASAKVIAVDGIKACESQPTLVILDRYMKEKKYFLEKLKCNILRVKRNNTIEIVRGPPKAPFKYDEMLPELSYSSFHVTPPVNIVAAHSQKVQLEQTERIADAMSKAKSMNDLPCLSGSPEPDNALDTNADNPTQVFRSKSDSKLDIDKVADSTTNVEQVSPEPFAVSHPFNSERSKETSENSNLSKFLNQLTLEVPSSSSSYKISECEICKYRFPNIDRELKSFSYSEIQSATNNFSSDNFISEGGFGLVYKGRLEDGQHIAVKQHKEASSQGEKEFRSEVEVLSYAQHKNLVTLLGFCSQDNHRLLVYEYVCNGSLDKHLSNKVEPLQWNYRKKIAEGTARGLRYLHEECKGGCIVHRDMRPNNILVTHDFEPMVGDFGLARSQKPLEADNETRVVGSFGYLAPEYAESGKVSTKTDVYSFGMVLLELITGHKALDRTLPGQSLLAWARPLLDDRRYHELIDPLLMESHDVHELYCMVRAAGLCLRKDPISRPTMNQVVKILEGSMLNQLDEDSPTMGGSESFIQMIETSLSVEERSSQSGRRSHGRKKSTFTYYEML